MGTGIDPADVVKKEVCDDNIYRFGEVVTTMSGSHEQLTTMCKDLTDGSEWNYDWHNSAGRQVIKRLPKGFVPPKAFRPVKDHEIARIVNLIMLLAKQYGHAQSCREVISSTLGPILKALYTTSQEDIVPEVRRNLSVVFNKETIDQVLAIQLFHGTPEQQHEAIAALLLEAERTGNETPDNRTRQPDDLVPDNSGVQPADPPPASV